MILRYTKTTKTPTPTGNTPYSLLRQSYGLFSAVSVFALHPLYIRIEAVSTDKEILKEVEEKRLKLNSLKQIDFVVCLSFSS